jgi:Family of unknown function (DUF6267)
MVGFAEFLTESKEGKNTHITHLEDVVMDDGPSGWHFALGTLKAFGRMLDGGTVSKSLNVSVKWDGAPAIIFGPDPADGEFFVATKHGAFAKTPKLAKTHAQIDAFYESGVKVVLHVALDYLSALRPSNVLQGDILYTNDTLSDKEIGGQNFLTFQPNTIIYAVDAASAFGQRIAASDIGIVIHTQYTGRSRTLADYRASAVTPSVFSQLKQSHNVVCLDAAYDDVSGTATFTGEEKEDFMLALELIESAARSVSKSTYELVLSEPLHGLIAIFLNAQVRENKSAWSVNDLIEWLGARMNKDKQAKKSEAGQKKVESEFAQLIGKVRAAKQQLANLAELHYSVTVAKNIVVRKLGQASRVSTFVKTAEGFKVTGPEGFVAAARSGKVVKLVDRLEFSRNNFMAIKAWG